MKLLTPDKRQAVLTYLGQGLSLRATARLAGVNVNTVIAYKHNAPALLAKAARIRFNDETQKADLRTRAEAREAIRRDMVAVVYANPSITRERIFELFEHRTSAGGLSNILSKGLSDPKLNPKQLPMPAFTPFDWGEVWALEDLAYRHRRCLVSDQMDPAEHLMWKEELPEHERLLCERSSYGHWEREQERQRPLVSVGAALARASV